MAGCDDEAQNPYRWRVPRKKSNPEVTSDKAYKLGCRYCKYFKQKFHGYACVHPNYADKYVKWLSYREEPKKVPKDCPLRRENE
jgi:hypothetical protein